MSLWTAARRLVGRLVAPVRNATAYEAGSNARRTTGWHAPTASANAAILGNLTTLRDRARAATRNDGFAEGAIGKLAANIVGTGIKPLSQAADPAFRAQAQALWLRWTDEADADGLFDFYGLQTLAVRSWLEGGECFARLRLRLEADGLSVPLQVQLLEPELCPHTNSQVFDTKKIRAGIEFNAIGQRVAYQFHPSRPELDDYDASRLVSVPADLVAHVYQPLRPGQLRGLPHLTQALVALYELRKFSDAVLIRQQVAAMFAGFMKRAPAVSTVDTIDPLTNETRVTVDSKPMVNLQPGTMQELEPGEEVNFTDPPDAKDYPDFMRQCLYQIAAAIGLPYELLTGDMRNVNDRTVRVILNEFRGRVSAWQHQVLAYQFCRKVWRAWMDQCWLHGLLPIPDSYATDPSPWLAVKWMPPLVPYIQPVQDIQAQKDAIRSGLTSRSATVSEHGEDAEAIDLEQQMDNERADRLGLVYDTDPRKVSNAGLTQARAKGSEYVDPDDPANGEGQEPQS
jgi:lambda family phage portal protein